MKIRQFSIFDKEEMVESLQQGEYYVWTVHFSDGTAQKVKVTSDELSQADLEQHFGKPIIKIERSWGIQGGGLGAAPSDYHSQQDNIERQARDDKATGNGNMHEADQGRRADDRPWRKDGTPLNKPPSTPNYPTTPHNHDQWMSTSKKMEEDSSEMPEPGDAIRTRKSAMEGRVERMEGNEVFFRTPDGRLMKTPCSNAIVITKLADCDAAMFEQQELTELSTALLAKYKSAAGKSATASDSIGDIKTGNKRFSGIVKATNKQFANDAKKNVVANEGSMGGINRSRPAQDVSYEKVLDRNPQSAHSKVVGEEQVNELSAGKMQAYKDKAGSPDSFRTRPLRKLAKSSQAVSTVNQKIAQRRQPASKSFEDRLDYFLEGALDNNAFADILGKQEQEKQAAAPKAAVKDIPYHNWTIRYRPAAKPGEKVKWQVMDRQGDIKHKGESMSDKDAVGDAEDWVDQGGGTKQQSNSSVTIDFNVDFAKQFAPGGERFYATIDQDNGVPVLMFSTELQPGFKNSHIRTQKEKTTATTTQLPTITMSAKEANAVGLQPNGRYLLGAKDPVDDNTAMFPLIFQGVVQGKGDRMMMGKPGLTVAHPRDVTVHEATMNGSPDLPFSELVQDTIAKHGVKWAFEYYVKKGKIPARQFQIYAGLGAKPPGKNAGNVTQLPTRPNIPQQQDKLAAE